MWSTNAIKEIGPVAYRNVIGPESSWFWAMATFFAILLSLIFIYRQVRHQRQANMLSTLACLDARWKSKEMLVARQHVCQDYQKNEKTISQPEDLVLSFFEEIGLYLRTGVFDISIVWEFYSYYAEHYWGILQPRITEFRASSQDKTWFSAFEYLATQLANHSKKRRAAPAEKTDEQIKKFIRGEVAKIDA
jgi:hypothetical protein